MIMIIVIMIVMMIMILTIMARITQTVTRLPGHRRAPAAGPRGPGALAGDVPRLAGQFYTMLYYSTL